MDNPDPSTAVEPNETPDSVQGLPQGNHPLEIAARRGLGPLSPLGDTVWHGQTRPCVSCGQLVRRDTIECDQCGQDLSAEMLEKMRAHAGPWYVLEHVRPFPGVSLDRIIRQIRRGLIAATSIVRGPSTDYQWRFAIETPGLCRYFARCWKCQATISAADTACPQCFAHLSFEQPRPAPTGGADVLGQPSSAVEGPGPHKERRPLEGIGADSGPGEVPPATPQRQPQVAASSFPADINPSDELSRLSAAIHRADVPTHEDIWDAPPRIGGIRATWVAAGLVIIVIVVLLWFTRTRPQASVRSGPATPGIVSLAP